MRLALRPADTALLIAVIVAIALALAGISSDPARLPSGAVASVNGVVIDRASLQAYVDQLAIQLRRAPGAQERSAVLGRFIDEELLLQQGLVLDLPRKDSRLRAQIVQEVIRQSIAVGAQQPVGEQELLAFYRDTRDYFRRGPLFRVAQYDCPDRDTARALVRELAGGGDGHWSREGVSRNDFVPDAWLPESKLRDYLGSDVVTRVASLAPGGALVDAREGATPRVLHLLAMQPARVPSLEEIRAQVESEFRRRRDEAALAVYMERLRSAARIQLADEGN
jgi:hypothetical protein